MIDEQSEQLCLAYAEKGAGDELQSFEQQHQARFRGGQAASVWALVRDAITGEGGFASGAYLEPFTLEREPGTNLVSPKFQDRKRMADYEPFPASILGAPKDIIAASADLIARETEDDLLGEFWQDCDGRGSHIFDFLTGAPYWDAAGFGTGLVFVDRPAASLRSELDDRAPENRAYVYSRPLEALRRWELDRLGRLERAVVLEDVITTKTRIERLIVWDRQGWARYELESKALRKIEDGSHSLGEVPILPIYWQNARPNPSRFLGSSQGVTIAKTAQTVYNIDSESRDIERKAGLILAVPVSDPSDLEGSKIPFGNDKALLYDAQSGGPPSYITPPLDILVKQAESRERKIRSAYDTAGLVALMGVERASSGYHAEIELAKAERAVTGVANALEDVENRIARLFLKWHGRESDVAISYPKQHGIRDRARLLEETKGFLELKLGDMANLEQLERFFRGWFPRKALEEIRELAQDATTAVSTGGVKGFEARLREFSARAAGGWNGSREGDNDNGNGSSENEAPR